MSLFGYKNKKNKNYFEGWYFRFTNSEENKNYALIFAITKDVNNPHSFIQFYDGVKNEPYYFSYAIEDFRYDEDKDIVYIKDNYISKSKVFFSNEEFSITCQSLNHEVLQKYKRHSSAMGYLQNAPLECFQEVIFISAFVRVDIRILQEKQNFTGKSYMEKTYGTNFPNKWVWIQSNYSEHRSSLSFSIGLIPVLFFKVKGFFLILHLQGVEYRFATYNNAKINIIKQSAKQHKIIVSRHNLRVEIIAKTQKPIKLIGPSKKGKMDLSVYESINAIASLKMYDDDEMIFEDRFTNVGLELMY